VLVRRWVIVVVVVVEVVVVGWTLLVTVRYEGDNDMN
jgi:uncharacterized protein involved in exopolysaccharide biosynthesis